MRLLKFLFIASPAAALAAVGAHYVLFDRYDYLAEAAVRDPENYCQTLFAEKNYRDLADYVAFYASVPGLTPTPAMEKLAEEAQAIRSDPSYIAKETAAGFFLGESHEDYGRAAQAAGEFFLVGDIRDIYTAGTKLAGNQSLTEPETFTAALSAVSLAVAAASIGPQATAGAAAKGGIAVLKVANRARKLSAGFIRELSAAAAKPAVLKTLAGPLAEIAAFARKYGVAPALEVLARTPRLEDAPRAIRSALSLGEDMLGLLKFGGPDVFAAVNRCGKTVVKEAAVYGDGAVRLLDKVPAARLMKDAAHYTKITTKAAWKTLGLILSVAYWLFSALTGILWITKAAFRLIRRRSEKATEKSS